MQPSLYDRIVAAEDWAKKKLVINGTLQTKLDKVKKSVEIVDAKGRRLGTFSPEPICPWDPSLSEDELDRRAREGGKPLAEVLKSLGAE